MMSRLSILIPAVLVLGLACNADSKTGSEANSEQATISAAPAKHEQTDRKVPEITSDKLNILREAGTEVTIVDVRTPAEVAEGKIPGAVEIDYNGDNFEAQIDALPRSKSYIVYCAAGGRSGKAVDHMLQSGFKNVYNLKGGYDKWLETQK